MHTKSFIRDEKKSLEINCGKTKKKKKKKQKQKKQGGERNG